MVDLSCNIAGVTSPNPFWLASAPPTDKQYNVERAFEAGWGGVVWKTLGEAGPPVVNVSSRYGSIDYNGQRMIGFNNIELITDRPLEVRIRSDRNVPYRVVEPVLLACARSGVWNVTFAVIRGQQESLPTDPHPRAGAGQSPSAVSRPMSN